MKLRMPQEIEVWYLLPAIRREFARLMSRRGMKQKHISRKLGITEPAVSQYISSKRARSVKFSRAISREIEKSVDSVMDGSDVIKETQRICELCRRDKTLCRIHKAHGRVPRGCRICFG